MRRAALVAALALAAAAPARAEDATPAQVRALAARAADDPAALAGLRRVTSVGGRPADLSAALGGASGPELRARLRALAAGGVSTRPLADPRGEARRVLDERRFRGSGVPRPFHGILQWLGDRLSFVGRFYRWLAGLTPGGSTVLWLALAGAVVLAAGYAGSRVAARHGGRLLEAGGRRRRGRHADPDELERRADEAERSGDLDTALRLRFRAGLLRLGLADAVPLRDSLTSGEAARLLHSEAFDRLAGDFDEVVYGGRAAESGDVAAARAEWPRVLEEARR